MSENIKILDASGAKENGQDKCPKCGSTEISPNEDGKLRCHYCQHIFDPEKVEDINKVEGQVISSGLKDIKKDKQDVITLKCSSCGAEVVIDTTFSNQARCHWCRNVLSINEQISNGSVPDVVLPFKIKKEEAEKYMKDFISDHYFFANPKFLHEFKLESIMGVFLPYVLVDVNAHAHFQGKGEHLKMEYSVSNLDGTSDTYYDADSYNVERNFDLSIDDLSIEASIEKLDYESKEKTTNIINSIMPFDTENCVKYNANYLKGYTAEKRDINVKSLEKLVEAYSKDIARLAAKDTLEQYDRGVAWEKEELSINGQQWKCAYLPIWLYSYKDNKSVIHYVAVNARTGETMGSIPVNFSKLFVLSLIVELLSVITWRFVDLNSLNWIYIFPGIVFFILVYARYCHAGAKYEYATEVKKRITKIEKVDDFIEVKKGLASNQIDGKNDTETYGQTVCINLMNDLKNKKK